MTKGTGYGKYRKHLTFYYTALQIIDHLGIPMEWQVSLGKTEKEMDIIIEQMGRAISEIEHWTRLHKKDETGRNYLYELALYLQTLREEPPDAMVATEEASPARVIEVFRGTIPQARRYIEDNKKFYPTYVSKVNAGKPISYSGGNIEEAKSIFNETLDTELYKPVSEDLDTIVVRQTSDNEIIRVVFLQNTEDSLNNLSMLNPTEGEYVVPVIVDRKSAKFEKPFKPGGGSIDISERKRYAARKLSPLEKELLNYCALSNKLKSILTYYNPEFREGRYKRKSFDSLRIDGYLDPNDPYIVLYSVEPNGRVVKRITKKDKLGFHLDESIEGFRWGIIAKSKNQLREDTEKERRRLEKEAERKRPRQVELFGVSD